MSAASTSVQAAPTNRQAGFAAFGLGLAALAVLAAVAYGQLSTTGQAVAPDAGAAPVQHDKGWSSASGQLATTTAPVLHDRGWSSAEGSAGGAWAIAPNSAAIDAGRHGSPGSVTVTPDGIRVTGSGGVSILYTGIPYGPPASDGSLGSTAVTSDGIRVTGSGGVSILYTGIPYAPPASDGNGGSNRLRLAQ